jgi:hypothetical protein
MTTALRLVDRLLGEPRNNPTLGRLLTDREAVCGMCGETSSVTADITEALGKNFTDRGCFHAPASTRVCPACFAGTAGKPPRTLRMWTVVATPGHHLPDSAEKAAAIFGQHPGICLTSNHDTTPVIDTLLAPPGGEWLVSVATSGQKHVLPYAHVNRGETGVVRMESTSIPYQRDDWEQVFSAALMLRRLGVPADDILAGTPRYIRTHDALVRWRGYDASLEGWHLTPLLSLALWTITKGITDDHDTYPDYLPHSIR